MSLKILSLRVLRTLVGTLIPIALPSVAMGVGLWIGSGDIAELLKTFGFFLYGAWFFGIPSLIAAVIMEFVVNPRVERDWRAYVIGGVLGMMCATAPFIGALDFAPGLTFAIGLPMGLITTWVMRRWYRLRRYG